jgi:cytochrome c553
MKQRLCLLLPLALASTAAIAAPPVGDAERGGKIHRGEIAIEGAAACSTCHGVDGNQTINGTFPRLAGQYPEYLVYALESYANGNRNNAVMMPIASALSRKDMEDLAAFYGQLNGELRTIPKDR